MICFVGIAIISAMVCFVIVAVVDADDVVSDDHKVTTVV
jgi:hypothetical protein